MDIFRNVVYSACLIGLITSLVEILSPGQRLSKQIRLIFSMMFIAAVFGSVLGSGGNTTTAVSYIRPADTNISDMGEEALMRAIASNIDASLSEMLEKEGIECEEISVNITTGDNACISISEVRLLCAEEDFPAARVLLTKRLGDIEITLSEKSDEIS